uniref:RNase H domain-containing protein n=1 Tax=Haemonchus contortus TaxID=6289 RepID=A0A7I4YWU9_HAECO
MFAKKLDWDSKVDSDFAQEWQKATTAIDKFYVEIPRQVFSSEKTDSKPFLWIFADASNSAMAVCGYLENSTSTAVSQLISGKTKLAPQKRTLSTPKLELLAVLLAFRLAESIAFALNYAISTINIASDSLIALSWIRTVRKVPLFVANQRDKIKAHINRLIAHGCQCQILHVPGEKNLADAGTRGVTSAQLEISTGSGDPNGSSTTRSDPY